LAISAAAMSHRLRSEAMMSFGLFLTPTNAMLLIAKMGVTIRSNTANKLPIATIKNRATFNYHWPMWA
jgi:hypothetical protein